jgi:hypothetical protein
LLDFNYDYFMGLFEFVVGVIMHNQNFFQADQPIGLHIQIKLNYLYLYCCWRSNYQAGRVGTPLTSLTLSYIYICKCLSQVRIRISNVICRGDFSVQWFDRWLFILLVINCSSPLFKLSFPYWRFYYCYF